MNHRLVIEDLTVSYNRIPAVHHLNVSLGCGSGVGLIGPNGAGKTTLLKAIAGLMPIETGRILTGEHAGANSAVAYVPQRESVDWDFPITVRALVEMGRYPDLGLWGRFTAKDHAIVDEALQVAELADFADRQIKALSGGQQQRAFLARAWAQQAHIYLLDEPFTGLDRNAQDGFVKALDHLREAGKLVIASHHDLKSVPEIFDHVLLINGELVACGKTGDVYTEENIARTFATEIFSGSRSHHHHA
jgi:ABC-type Mn2+/Zn2+ transport system ATPase subunit